MNEEEQNKMVKKAVEEIIRICQLFGIDYFKLGNKTQNLLTQTYIAGMQYATKYMIDVKAKIEKQGEKEFKNENTRN